MFDAGNGAAFLLGLAQLALAGVLVELLAALGNRTVKRLGIIADGGDGAAQGGNGGILGKSDAARDFRLFLMQFVESLAPGRCGASFAVAQGSRNHIAFLAQGDEAGTERGQAFRFVQIKLRAGLGNLVFQGSSASADRGEGFDFVTVRSRRKVWPRSVSAAKRSSARTPTCSQRAAISPSAPSTASRKFATCRSLADPYSFRRLKPFIMSSSCTWLRARHCRYCS